jgi:hypothetical protein
MDGVQGEVYRSEAVHTGYAALGVALLRLTLCLQHVTDIVLFQLMNDEGAE